MHYQYIFLTRIVKGRNPDKVIDNSTKKKKKKKIKDKVDKVHVCPVHW